MFDLTEVWKNVRIRRLDHHGIVSGVFTELGFEDVLNELIGVDEQEVVTAGQAVKAMVLCGLGFTHRPMMLTPQFFSNLAVDELIGPGIKAEDLNRHKLGRTLDALSEKGIEGIFSVLASKACAISAIDRSAQSLDTTSFSVTGEYDVDTDTEAVRVCHGYSKETGLKAARGGAGGKPGWRGPRSQCKPTQVMRVTTRCSKNVAAQCYNL